MLKFLQFVADKVGFESIKTDFKAIVYDEMDLQNEYESNLTAVS